MLNSIRLNAGTTEPKILQLLTIIGELKTPSPLLLQSVKNPITKKVCTAPMFNRLVTEKVVSVTDTGQLTFAVKAFEILKYYNRPYKHIIKDPDRSESPHTSEIQSFLYPIMFSDGYHATIYPKLDKHELRPDACLVFSYPEGQKIQFVEVEHTDKHAGYLVDKYKKYSSFGQDVTAWDSWWKRWADSLGLPYCTKEEFKFSVLCKGNKTFEWEGWEWI